MAKYEKIGNFQVFFDKTYFIAYAGGKREMEVKKQKDWNKTNNLPFLLQMSERRKLGQHGNPNLIPIKGIDLLSFFKELGYIPFFDFSFINTGILQLTDVLIYESIKQKSYEIVTKRG